MIHKTILLYIHDFRKQLQWNMKYLSFVQIEKFGLVWTTSISQKNNINVERNLNENQPLIGTTTFVIVTCVAMW